MANTSGPQAAIGNGQTMNRDAAAHWSALVQRILSETGLTIIATEGTRAYARQKELYDGYRAGKPGYNPAWSPDSPKAYHLSGRAVDVGSYVGYSGYPQYHAFRRFAGEYGFRETVPGEPWHFEWRADWVKTHVDPASSDNATPFPDSSTDQSEEDELNTDQSNQLTEAWRASAVAKDNSVAALAEVKALRAELSGRFALVRSKGKAEVFLSVDRQSLRWLPTEAQLKDQQYTLGLIGATNLGVQEVDNLSAFGSIGSNTRPSDPFYSNL